MLDEAAEFFLADVMVRALAIGNIFESLVLYLKAFQVGDQDVTISQIPDLILLQFHWCDSNGNRTAMAANLTDAGITSAGQNWKNMFLSG